MKIPTANSVRVIFAYVLALLLLSQLAFSLFAWRLFDQELPPEMARKAATIGQSIQGKLIAAVKAGIPFDKLVGIDDFFSETIKSNRDLAFLALTASDGTVRNAVGIDLRAAANIMSGHEASPNSRMERFTSRVAGMDYAVTSLPIVVGGSHVGTLDVGVSQSFIDSRIGEIRIDIVTIVLISLLVAYEILRFILSVRLEEPLWQVWSILSSVAKGDFREVAGVVRNNDLGRLAKTINHLIFAVDAAAARLSEAVVALGTQGQGKAIQEAWARLGARFKFAPTPPGPRVRPQTLVIQIRILTFLFMFAEQLSRPFLPLMVRSLLPSWAVGHSADILTGLPISAFMFVVAIGMPIAGRWSERLGPRNAFTAGAIMMTVGLFGAAASISIYDFTVWRIVTAAGYATMFMACQGFVFGNTGERERAKGISTFVGAIMVSEVCAPAIGGILADRIGPHPVFAIGAVVAIVVACLGRSILQKHERRRTTAEDAPKLLNVIVGLHNVRFVALLLFAAVPAKMMLTGFLFYLVPLVLTSLGSSQAEIGRIVIAYGIPGLVLMPLFASLADRFSVHGLMVGLGGIIVGLGMLPILFYPDEKMVLVGVAGLGIGQAMSIAPQIALVEQVCEKEVAAFGEASVLGLFRLVERSGAALGSLVAGALLASFGPLDAMGMLGAGSAVSAVLFSIVFLALGVRPEEPLDTIAPVLLGQGADA